MAAAGIVGACERDGIETGAGVRAAIDGPEQLALIEAGDAVAGQLGATWSGKGRKPGSKNRATRDVVEFVRNAYTDPLIWMGQVASMPIDEVRRRFRIEKGIDAARYQLDVIKELRAVLYPTQTLADLLQVPVGEGVQVLGLAALFRGESAAPSITARQDDDVAPLRVPMMKQNQGVSDD